MLDGSLSSAYSQYKEDTDSVAAWLASTARKCGYQPEQLSSAAKAGPGRLKGKARKDAKKYQQAPQIAPSTPKHIIAIKDFIPLAEHILASTKPMIKVPAAFAMTIDRVIYLRSKFGEKMKKRGIETDKDSDESHNYFVGVLETVRSILRPRMPVETPESVSLEDLTNRFMGLGVEEPSQEFLDAPDLVRPEKVQGDDNNYEAELLKSFDDAFMACTALVNDLNDIRQNILAMWNALSGYDGGGLDPAVAAVTTNTAIDLARNLIEQVLPILEAQGNPCHVLEQWARYQAQDAGFTDDEVSSWGKPGAGNEKMYTIAERCYLNANVLLRNFINRIGNKDPTQVTLGVFEAYDPKSNRFEKDGHAKFKEDEQILGALLTEAMTLTHGVKDYPVEDEFLRGVSEMEQTGKRPLYLTFAAQVVLDIHALLREDADLAFNHAGAQIDTMRADLRLQMEFNARMKPPGWPAQNERALRALESKMGWVKEDPVFLAKKRRAEKSGVLVEESQRHQMLVLSPIISGLLLFHFRAQMYEFSILVMNCLGSVAYSVHLYNALVNEEYLEKDSWRDLEFVQHALGGKSSFFVGHPPTDTEGYNKRLILQMGYSVSAISNQGLLKGNSKSRSGVRLIKGRSPVTSMFIDRYTRGSARVNFSPEDIDEIISRNQNVHRQYAKGSNQVNISSEDAEAVGHGDYLEPRESGDDSPKIAVYASGGKREKPRFPTRREKPTEGGKLKPQELLKPLSSALTGEIMEFALPFLYMHRITWDVLAGIKAACDPILQRVDSPYLEREYSVPFVVAYIFGVLCKDPEGAGEELMCAAADAFDKIITEKGMGDAVMKRFSQCHGVIIKSREELYGESHKRYHDRNDMEPVEDCAWDCGWRHDWENRDIKENEDDKEKEDDKES